MSPPPTPVPATTTRTSLDLFVEAAASRYGVVAGDYWQLHRWSITEPGQFWELVWDFYGVRASTPYDRVLSDDPMPHQRWFEGAHLNYADQVLRHCDRPGAAVVSIHEDGTRTELRWSELGQQVAAFAHTLRAHGVRRGDRVVGYLTNSIEAIVAFLGCASVGAVWAGCAPDYGAAAAGDRLRQLEPTVLVAVTAYQWAGTIVDRRTVVAELAHDLGVRTVVCVERSGLALDTFDGVEVVGWQDAISPSVNHVEVEQVPTDHPLWVLFSSGTTGVPKGIVHGHAGVLLAHLSLLGLQHDLGPGDTLFWYTTTNWMLWNVVVSALLVGATTVVYEGSPIHPGPDRLWQIVEQEQVTVFGTSPGHLQHSASSGLRPSRDHVLGSLTQVAATGAPVAPALFDWVRDEVGPDLPLVSVCGGTDVVSAFLGGAPNLPVRAGEISGPQLGVAASTFGPDGTPVRDTVGELVVTAPYPSMPIGFWNDPDGSKYHAAYFDTFPQVWRQGDWATHTGHGTFIVHGRSDSTLNRNGVRIGSSDLYQIVEKDPAVSEALVLGVELPDGSYRMPMFLVPSPGHQLTAADLTRLQAALRSQGSPRHVPDEMHVVDAIPHTKTGKKLEIPLKRILQGVEPADAVSAGAVDRPELLSYYTVLARQWAEERSG
ncbi:acetoacetyl-CoA synthetase [Nocardioides alpinus]|uniref:Acetoacetate--CoA ligase n=1 Tax=Nocardioides alpinus TaxID=748909 RepID=A0A1I0YA90_9ACTN|nr:acetoacetate--CoA ligase [Nocardioides alpinus]PKH38977.1 acetoacetate--CoA ligase [Nocardioides alpinus]SFB09717.1 acetoacetyl-CoA synthetase [Nocardioides alpinus]